MRTHRLSAPRPTAKPSTSPPITSNTLDDIDLILDDIDELLEAEDEFLTTYRQKGGQ